MSVPENDHQKKIPENLLPTYSEKTIDAMKAERAVKRINFYRTEASQRQDASCFSAQAEQ